MIGIRNIVQVCHAVFTVIEGFPDHRGMGVNMLLYKMIIYLSFIYHSFNQSINHSFIHQSLFTLLTLVINTGKQDIPHCLQVGIIDSITTYRVLMQPLSKIHFLSPSHFLTITYSLHMYLYISSSPLIIRTKRRSYTTTF